MYKIFSPFRITIWALWAAFCVVLSFVLYLFTFNKKTIVWTCKYIWSPLAIAIPGERLTIIKNNKIDYSKPHVFVANHQSYLDIPSVVRAVDSLLYFVAKKELKKIPFLGQYITLSGMIFIDRSNRNKAIESMKNAAYKVKEGKSVFVFPEGTRTKTDNLLPFKKGAFMLAIDAGVPIVPIAISGTGNIFPATKVEFKPGKAKLKILDPIDTSAYNKDNVDELIELCTKYILTERDNLSVN